MYSAPHITVLLLLLLVQDEDPDRVLLQWKFEKGQTFTFTVKQSTAVHERDAKRKKWGKPVEEWSGSVQFQFTVIEVKRMEITGLIRINGYTVKGKAPPQELGLKKSVRNWLKKVVPGKLTLTNGADGSQFARPWIDTRELEGFYDIASWLGTRVPEGRDGLFIRPQLKNVALKDTWANGRWTLTALDKRKATAVRKETRKPHPKMARDYGQETELKVEYNLEKWYPTSVEYESTRTDHVDQKPVKQIIKTYSIAVKKGK